MLLAKRLRKVGPDTWQALGKQAPLAISFWDAIRTRISKMPRARTATKAADDTEEEEEEEEEEGEVGF